MKTKILIFLAVALLAGLSLGFQTTSTGPMKLVGNPSDTQNSALFSVWLPNSTTQPQCGASTAGVPGCVFAVQSNGNLWFAGNNATYGYPKQMTQSFMRYYGSVDTYGHPFAPPYLQFMSGDGSVQANLYPSTTQQGRLCAGPSVPGGDCAPGTQLATFADLSSSGGTVTSVGLVAPPAEFIVSGSPVTTSGTLGIIKAVQAPNTVWAGPASGDAAVPTFRALTAADLPATAQMAPDSTPFVSAPFENSSTGNGAANSTPIWGFVLDPPTRLYDHIVVYPITVDTNTADVYSLALYQNCGGAAMVTTLAQNISGPANVALTLAFTQGGMTMPPGLYCLAMTGNAAVAKIAAAGRFVPYYSVSVGNTTGGQPMATIPAQVKKWQTASAPVFVLQAGAT